MRDRRVVHVLFVMLVCTACLGAHPAIAAPAAQLQGTVSSPQGQPVVGLSVTMLYSLDGANYAALVTSTDEAGSYAFTPSLSQTATVSVYVVDSVNGLYDVAHSGPFELGPDSVLMRDIQMTVEAAAPRIEMSAGQPWALRDDATSLLSAGFEGFKSNGTVPLRVIAQDGGHTSLPGFSAVTGSGIESIHYQVGDGPWQTTSIDAAQDVTWYNTRPLYVDKDIALNTPGVWTVRYYAVDRAGNAGPTSSLKIAVDTQAPQTGYRVPSAGSPTARLDARDDMTGVTATFVRDPQSSAGSTFVFASTFLMPESGSKTVQYYSVDRVGNIERVRSLKVCAPAGMGTPAPSSTSVRRGRSFTVSGQVHGRSLARGTVTVYRLSGGSWKKYTQKSFVEGSSGYRVSVKLPAGTYRFKASYGVADATLLDPRVSSGYSRKVVVR